MKKRLCAEPRNFSSISSAAKLEHSKGALLHADPGFRLEAD
jgi:hypothetical protein